MAEFGHRIRYFNTFGGNSVCVAAAAAVLDVIEAEGLLGTPATAGEYLLETLTAIAAIIPASPPCEARACTPASTSSPW